LIDLGQLQSGQRILIHGGTGGVGHFAVQLAKWKGTYVIATASTKNQELLRKLGADDTIDYTTHKFEDVAHEIESSSIQLAARRRNARGWCSTKAGL
jgi:NADPH:quinone reductase-like Zn-dependent oxidoreductase